MPEPVSLLMIEFLSWVSMRRRSYAETMEAWRSSCPRLSVWEDAIADGLIGIAGETLQQSEVTLTPRGKSVLDAEPALELLAVKLAEPKE
jgi:hypothetical protein